MNTCVIYILLKWNVCMLDMLASCHLFLILIFSSDMGQVQCC